MVCLLFQILKEIEDEEDDVVLSDNEGDDDPANAELDEFEGKIHLHF